MQAKIAPLFMAATSAGSGRRTFKMISASRTAVSISGAIVAPCASYIASVNKERRPAPDWRRT